MIEIKISKATGIITHIENSVETVVAGANQLSTTYDGYTTSPSNKTVTDGGMPSQHEVNARLDILKIRRR